jgi:integrase
MARPASGQVVERVGKTDTTFALRFRAYGKREYVTLGTKAGGWTLEKAEDELANVQADVRRGIWRPPAPTVAEPPRTDDETFQMFASIWFEDREGEWRLSTAADYRWALEVHLLPVFGHLTLSAITKEEVDRYARAKQGEGNLSNNSINKTLNALSTILDQAVDWDRIPLNPAKGKNRRLRGEPRQRLHVEPEQLLTLLGASHASLRPLLATLAGGGLRIGEAIALKWGDVNLAASTIRVRESKTPAGIRTVDMPVGLAAELRSYKARCPATSPTSPVFRKKRSEEPQTIRNAQQRLKQAIKDANTELKAKGIEPISDRVTPHSLRRTFASLRFGAGEDPIYVAEQGGWDDPALPMRIYAKAMRRRSKLTGEHLKAFDAAIDWARMGTNAEMPTATDPANGLLERYTA